MSADEIVDRKGRTRGSDADGNAGPSAPWPRAFTLIEMLVVIAIIGILAAIILPVLGIARERARRASCKNQLHEFGIAIELYKGDYGEMYPPWLSSLYPTYMPAVPSYICPNDDSRGTEGGVPAWFSKSGASQFTEIDDTDNCTASAEAQACRNAEIHACSYTYEFSIAECSWWDQTGKSWADFDHNGYVSWREAKLTEQRGIVGYSSVTGKYVLDDDEVYDGHVPAIRCFWHAQEGGNLNTEIALNLACENKNIYQSPIYGEGWKQQTK